LLFTFLVLTAKKELRIYPFFALYSFRERKRGLRVAVTLNKLRRIHGKCLSITLCLRRFYLLQLILYHNAAAMLQFILAIKT
jgi:hypothetical protein